MRILIKGILLSLLVSLAWIETAGAEDLRINQLQFVGSHNSYKLGMSPEHAQALQARNPAAAQALDYAHRPLVEQLDLGIRKLELDVFYRPQDQTFVVGHVQVIDMNSHCPRLRDCLRSIVAWSNQHPDHVPLWISFNAKDQAIEGLPDPASFDVRAWAALDQVLIEELADRLIWPREVRPPDSRRPIWPTLTQGRGKILLILREVFLQLLKVYQKSLGKNEFLILNWLSQV